MGTPIRPQGGQGHLGRSPTGMAAGADHQRSRPLIPGARVVPNSRALAGRWPPGAAARLIDGRTHPQHVRLGQMSSQGSPGKCTFCGTPVAPMAEFVSIGPTDWNDPTRPKSRRWVPAGTDIHAGTPFVVAHGSCYSAAEGAEDLARLIEDAGRSDLAAVRH